MNFVSKQFSELTNGELYEILKSRAKIFVVEQKINYVDMDDADYVSRHFFLKENDRVVAYLRAFYTTRENTTIKIGRVLTTEHGKGLGGELMKRTMDEIISNKMCKKIVVSAQKHAVGFYKHFGFKEVSGEYEEEGIVHISMELLI